MIVESKEAIKVEKTTLDKKFHLISYWCQMNFADSEVVASILESIGYSNTNKIENSDLILLNTCSIREKAEQTIRKKLSSIDHLKKKNRTLKIGVLGCMAERLKEKFLIEETQRTFSELLMCISPTSSITRNANFSVVLINCNHEFWVTGNNYIDTVIPKTFFKI